MSPDPTRPALLLRLEGAVALMLALVLYREIGEPWVRFAILLLAPDLSLVGYFGGRRTGAIAYNLAHTYAIPALLFAAGLVLAHAGLMSIGLIWGAHIGADRLLGFGLKYATDRRETHLQRVRTEK